jgi:peptide/nickel transport system ATP-binding protein
VNPALADLQRLNGFALLFITDDLAIAAPLGDSIGVLESGCLLEWQQTRELFNRLQSDYSRQLISSSRTWRIL